MLISDWSSDVCSSDLHGPWSQPALLSRCHATHGHSRSFRPAERPHPKSRGRQVYSPASSARSALPSTLPTHRSGCAAFARTLDRCTRGKGRPCGWWWKSIRRPRSEEHTSELQSLMRISYAVFCLKKKQFLLIIFNLIYTLLSFILISYFIV